MATCATIDHNDHVYITLIPMGNSSERSPIFYDLAKSKPFIKLEKNKRDKQKMIRHNDTLLGEDKNNSF